MPNAKTGLHIVRGLYVHYTYMQRAKGPYVCVRVGRLGVILSPFLPLLLFLDLNKQVGGNAQVHS